MANQGRELGQRLDKAPDAHDFLPAVTVQQAAQQVPVRVLSSSRRAEDLHQFFQQPAPFLPIFDKRGQGPCAPASPASPRSA